MNAGAFRRLKRGDIVKHKHDARTFVVTANYGDHVTAVSSVDMTNPHEWVLCDERGTAAEVSE